MAKYLLVYRGGMMETDPKKAEEVMAQWGAWFAALGGATVDPGAPTQPGKSVSSGGVTSVGADPVTGYSVLQADSQEAAEALAKGCPIIAAGGQVEVYELVPMPM